MDISAAELYPFLMPAQLAPAFVLEMPPSPAPIAADSGRIAVLLGEGTRVRSALLALWPGPSVGFCGPHPLLHSHLSARENLALAATLYGLDERQAQTWPPATVAAVAAVLLACRWGGGGERWCAAF